MAHKNAIKSINLAENTINFAHEQVRARSRCKNPNVACPPVHNIRQCLPEQLRAICPPEPCVCPEPPRPIRGGERFVKNTILLTKWLFFLGFIKWTNDIGIWENADSTRDLVQSANDRLSAIKPKEDTGNYYGLTYNLATMWNTAIGNVFYVIGVLPSKAAGKVFGVIANEKDDPASKK